MRPFLRSPRIKKIPIPRDAKTVEQISKHLNGTLAPEPPLLRSEVNRSMPDPSQIEPSQLQSPDGVWYFVERSRAGNLPVYTDFNNAGGVWTEVRKIQGSAPALKNDLKKLLGLAKKDIWVQGTSQRVIIRGNKSKEVKDILGDQF